LRWRTGVKIIPVNCYSSNKFQITKQALEEAFAKAERANIPVKGILITNPSNPLGTAITRPVLKEILNFISDKNIHLISDEIYSGSVFSSEEFISVAEMLQENDYYDAPRVHIVYSLSKDLGLPGFRVGAIYSYIDAVVATARRMSSFTLVSSQTQKMLSPMLSDLNFTKNYIKTNRERLKRRYEYVVERLRECSIECLNGNAGLFCWMNLKPLLDEATTEGELKLWNMILKDLKLDISPGSSCHCTEPGWFRVCFANMSIETLDVALARLTSFMEKKRKA
jgi:1-aminocyclopropane-1-carboxylate synthase